MLSAVKAGRVSGQQSGGSSQGRREGNPRSGRWKCRGAGRAWHAPEFQQVRVAAAGNEGEYLQDAGGEKENQTTWDGS